MKIRVILSDRSRQVRLLLIAAASLSWLAAASVLAPAHAEISCSIAPSLGITQVLGMPSAVTTMSGPAADKDISGATTTICSYTGGTGTVTLSVIELASPAEARAALTEALVVARLKEAEDPNAENIEVAPEAGLGERAIAAITARTAGDAALKGSRILIVGASGPGLAPKDLLPKVRDLTATVLGKL